MINDEITDKEIRLIDADGSQLGIMDIKKAMDITEEKNLDLVKIAPQANPPVCRIMDYGKYRFELSKKEKEQRKNQKVTEVKEIRLSLMIDVHDFNTKVKHALKFIQNGDKVKVSVRFRGREMQHQSQGVELLNRFAEAMSEVASVDKKPKLEGRSMVMFLTAK
ncbi:MAG: translation initiation factor IF-3 [Clostridia bacterium]|nr:translation initiation factor IF-3 [Clostridia bacterium]MBQ4248423.1 translation initiation factor IF-3 [Clostridia bacterium]